MTDKRTIDRAYYKAKSEAFERSDTEGGWIWRPTPYEAFRLGYEAAEKKHKAKKDQK